MAFTSTRLPTAPNQEDLDKRDAYLHSLKVAFTLLSLITAIILGVGIYVAVDPGQNNYGLMVLGYVLIALAIACLIASVLTGDRLFRLIRAISETKDYRPKAAEALRQKPYPRQPSDSVRRRRAPAHRTTHTTLTQSETNSQEPRRGAGADGVGAVSERVAEPLPAPSAPPANVSVDITNSMNGEEEECGKVIPPAADLERPPPFAPPPGLSPPPYTED
ncbi:unnamed protein product [Hydatigera taeniaeformis]|uniref:IncA protein n=1 Tax=Hydatigena taeniaeformis TaxID=6205 RepID=A0A0R3WN20_HYDTA|nr:unnamed protein product [Hydatigera taeniaeformis]